MLTPKLSYFPGWQRGIHIAWTICQTLTGALKDSDSVSLLPICCFYSERGVFSGPWLSSLWSAHVST